MPGDDNIKAHEFLNFIHQPIRADPETVVCKLCPEGLDCAQNPSATDPVARTPAVGFHGGIVVKAGYWRVDWSPDADNLAVRCKNSTACAYGGRCLPGSHRAGPKCQTCELGYGMRIGGCLPCEHQNYTPLIVIFSLVVVVAIFMTIFRKQLVEMRFVWRDIGRIVKVVVDTMQIIASMPEVLGGITWPDELLILFSYMDLSSLDLTQFLGIACFGQREATYYARSGLLLGILSLVFLCAVAVYYFANWRTRRWWQKKASEEERLAFIRASLDEVFDLADIDDNGVLDMVEAEEVARLVGNKEIERKLVLEMHKMRDIQLADDENLGKGSKTKTPKSEDEDAANPSNEIFMDQKEFVDFMSTVDDAGNVALRASSKARHARC